MSRLRILLWSIALLAISVAFYYLPNTRKSSASIGSANDVVDHDMTTIPVATDAIPFDSRKRVSLPVGGSGDEGSCLSIEQLETHPILVKDSYRFDSVSTNGPSIAAYRDLSAAQLRSFASQGDSAAMSVLGAVSIMRARKLSDIKAVPYLLFEDRSLHTYVSNSSIETSTNAHLEEAGEWFYKAALNGRVMALYQVGDTLWNRGLGPVELGWIDNAEYEQLSSFQKTALIPSNVYNVLAFEIAPELKTGPSGRLIFEMLPRSKRQEQAINALKKQFNEDLKLSGLPPISIPASAAPPIEELMSMVCDSVLKQQIESHSE